MSDREHALQIELYARVVPALPDSAVIYLPSFEINFQLTGADNSLTGALEVEIVGSHGKCSFRTAEEDVDIPTLRNTMSHLMDRLLNIQNYTNCRHHTISLEHMLIGRGGKMNATPILPGWEELEAVTQEARKVDPFVLLNLQFRDLQLSRALADLRNALSHHDDTAFFSYRAIESIKAAFLKGGHGGDDENGRAWETMRDRLRISKPFIMDIKDKADSQRHGRVDPMDADDRLEAMRRAWLIVDRYVLYATRKGRRLTDDVSILE